MADNRTLNGHYAKIGANLIANEEMLADIRCSQVTIVYLSSTATPKADGGEKIIKGRCEKVADKFKWGIPADYMITIFEGNCKGMTEEQIRILIFHELMHIEIGMDDNGKEQYKVKSHDLEDFKYIIDRFGTDWSKVDELTELTEGEE